MATLPYKECFVIVVYAMISRSLTAREITYNNFEISLVVFMPNITTNHAITYTNNTEASEALVISLACVNNETNNLQLVRTQMGVIVLGVPGRDRGNSD